MIEVEVRDQNQFEKYLKLFIKKMKKDGILRELRDRRYFKKPSDIRREKAKASKRKKRIQK